jgi:hypothetical protein
MKQINQEKGFFVRLSEVLSTHPPLPKRIYEIEAFFGGEETISFQKKRQTAAITWLFIFVASLTVFGAGIYYFINHFTLPDMLTPLRRELSRRKRRNTAVNYRSCQREYKRSQIVARQR